MSICNLPEQFKLIFNENHPLSCSDLEIIQLERQQGINLPSTYKDFLKIMGHGAGKFLRGSDCFYQHLSQIQEWAKQLLVENDFPQTLPEDAFVFFMHQGYQFSFFRLSEGDNPPTYSYCEGQEELDFVKSHDQFSDFLSVEINLYLKSLMLLAS
ncbi:SMI1/KNR4 family protein [Dolichospermum circinale CS-534/05]|uniref:SMI1/KNR4 family protein n=1 Tax=Dolichospermum circinale TaxID=109265 RepID=UPI00232AE0C8|nr:SMI1/KNR4 family protein [Dolichospermum circinale]MDB9456696.1 SMI1/KNR4 family protein [Dolichospermum circinale CS-541/06]MDB9462236.1 SMI1/KNR4 family protein [Dolichospermum circinale CS-541/04]MDB9490355.1 SMI1/KNR4 family protein [Dolichospermum circinale CS-534/05]MDB9548013.1 SMI1/KNR4 family protein [Dolichospermum circinale CS-1031]